MGDIFEYINQSDNIRPKYTDYEIRELIRQKLLASGLSKEKFLRKYNISFELFNDLIGENKMFTKEMLYKSAEILEVDIDELVEEYEDDLSSFSDAFNNKTFVVANKLFNEIIMQEKIGRWII